MSTRTPVRRDVEEFVAVCSARLSLTAFLLTHDSARAERLVQDALAETALVWDRLEVQPERYARERLVAGHLGWWHDTWSSQDRQRVVVVLRWWDGLTVAEVADTLGCPVATVDKLSARALAGTTPEAVGAGLAAELADLQPAVPPRVMDGVDREVGVLRGRRRLRRTALTALVGAATVAVLVALPGAAPETSRERDERPQVEYPDSQLLGRPIDPWIRLGGQDYVFVSTQESQLGEASLRLMLPPSSHPVALGWGSSPPGPGEVRLRLDGRLVARTASGGRGMGLPLAPGRSHVVVVRATQGNATTQVGLAVYRAGG